MYTMGDGADDILRSFGLSEEDKKKNGMVKGKFDSHFVKRRNTIFERAKFNMRIQGENELVDAFITDLYALAEHCGYADLHDEMIHDRIVVGLWDARLSENQLDGALTLDKAVSTVRQAEAVKEQQAALRTDGTNTPIGSVNKTKQTKQWPTRQPNSPGGKHCFRCGTIPYHSRQVCPARNATCQKCSRKGHFQTVCRGDTRVRGVHQDQEETPPSTDESTDTFLGAVGENPWVVNLRLNGQSVKFCIDT